MGQVGGGFLISRLAHLETDVRSLTKTPGVMEKRGGKKKERY